MNATKLKSGHYETHFEFEGIEYKFFGPIDWCFNKFFEIIGNKND